MRGAGRASLAIRSARDGGEAVLKITDVAEGARGLDRERAVLSKLAAEPRLERLRPLLPDVLAVGSDGGWSYLVQRSLARRAGDGPIDASAQVSAR